MANMTPQQQVQHLEQCIKDCKNVVNDLENLAQKAKNTSIQSTLKESVHHLEMCIHECDYATKANP